jgi:heme-degrading monooxygenase HmoA
MSENGGVDPTIARTPEPPYTAVIFTNTRTPGDHGYGRMSARMDALAGEQPGYLGHESARDGGQEPGLESALGITVSYWVDHAAAAAWKQVAEHLVAQERGRTTWYADYAVRIATVERDYTLGDRVNSDTGALQREQD